MISDFVALWTHHELRVEETAAPARANLIPLPAPIACVYLGYCQIKDRMPESKAPLPYMTVTLENSLQRSSNPMDGFHTV